MGKYVSRSLWQKLCFVCVSVERWLERNYHHGMQMRNEISQRTAYNNIRNILDRHSHCTIPVYKVNNISNVVTMTTVALVTKTCQLRYESTNHGMSHITTSRYLIPYQEQYDTLQVVYMTIYVHAMLHDALHITRNGTVQWYRRNPLFYMYTMSPVWFVSIKHNISYRNIFIARRKF